MEIDDSSDLFTISLRILVADPNSKMTSMQFTIPKMKNDCIYGDLNRDGIKDMIVSINGYAIVEELADNNPFSFIFVFLAQDKKYNLICHSFSNDICGCSSGVFYPELIQEGLILGDSKCFAQGDVPYCPSLIYSTTVGFDGNKLKFINKTNK